MKLATLALLPLLIVLAHGQPAATGGGTAEKPASLSSRPELAALEQFLNLSDAELAQMADAIARVRAMTPAQREQLRKEIVAFRQLPEQRREQLRQGWGWMPAEIQNGWREMMQHATPAERDAIQARLQSLSPAEKTAYRRRLVEEYLKKQPGGEAKAETLKR